MREKQNTKDEKESSKHSIKTAAASQSTQFTHLLASDIDGTLLRNGAPTPGLRLIRQLVEAHADKVALVYATGRSMDSTMDLVDRGILPRPSAVAPFIGTEIWYAPFDRPSNEYRQHIRQGWDREALMRIAGSRFGLKAQEPQFQSDDKASFILGSQAKMFDIRRYLAGQKMDSRVVYSCGKYLDIIPGLAGKANAVRHLARSWDIPLSNVLTCGDSGNDLDMLTAKHTSNVAVGNLEEELRDHMGSGRFYTSELPYAAGVLEGATAFGFWPPNPAPPSFTPVPG